tara:strand:+ start:63 stop:341 length:279 start_codon:yes stop_codon:yes gene_type:complete
MINTFELIDMFNLTEKPYHLLNGEWCTDGLGLYFIEDNQMYSVALGEIVGEKDDIVCCMIDVQQFLGWQPAVLSKHMQTTYETFEEKYGERM